MTRHPHLGWNTCRLRPPDTQAADDENGDLLPFEYACSENLIVEFIPGMDHDRKTVRELSRLAVSVLMVSTALTGRNNVFAMMESFSQG